MAIPSIYVFNQLPLQEQLTIVLGQGTYLTMRFGEEGGVKSYLNDTQWNELITNGTQLNNNWKARLDIIAGYL
jgi:hypothetical protein